MGEITVKSPGIAGEIKKGPSDLRMAEVRVAAPAGDTMVYVCLCILGGSFKKL